MPLKRWRFWLFATWYIHSMPVKHEFWHSNDLHPTRTRDCESYSRYNNLKHARFLLGDLWVFHVLFVSNNSISNKEIITTFTKYLNKATSNIVTTLRSNKSNFECKNYRKSTYLINHEFDARKQQAFCQLCQEVRIDVDATKNFIRWKMNKGNNKLCTGFAKKQ